MRLETAEQAPLARSRRVWDITRQLRELAQELRAEGLTAEALSLDTTIRDLEWQSESLVMKEFADTWPEGVREPLSHLSAVG